MRVNSKQLWRRIEHYVGIARRRDEMTNVRVVVSIDETSLKKDITTSPWWTICMDMSAVYAKGVGESLPAAQISYDRFHVIALANAAMDEVRCDEMRTQIKAVCSALGDDLKRSRQ